MPILVMALLALILFGLLGIMLSVAVMMEHSTPDIRPARRDASHPATSGVVPLVNPTVDRPRSEDAPTEIASTKEKVHEHACAG
jgi:hypothetical protein